MLTPSKRALIVIDLQNDYFPGGLFPLWNTEETLRFFDRLLDAACAVLEGSLAPPLPLHSPSSC